MLVVNAVSVAIQGLNMLNQLAAMLVAADPAYTTGMSAAGVQAMVLFFLELHRQGYLIAQIFFGLYLLPLGYLVFRSALFPTVLGLVLGIGCAGYLAGVAVSFLSPTFTSPAATYFGLIGGVAEMVFVGWLLIRGVKDQAGEARVSGSVKGAVA
jgi:hypothetical protein